MAAPTFVASTPGGTAGGVNWDTTSSGATRTTSSFSVTTGDVLVVVAGAADGGSAIGTPTGGSLTWTSQVNIGTSGTTSRVAIFTATATSTTSITVSVTETGGVGPFWGFRVYQFSGASIGNVASSAATSGTVAPSQAITTTAANSALVYGSFDWTASDGTTRTWRAVNSITPTSGNGLEKDYYRDSGGAQYTVYTAYWNDAGATGAKTVGLTAPATQRPAIAVLEIKGPTGPPPPFLASYVDDVGRRRHPKLRGAT